uniref:Lysozyme g n=1 Tax=Salmo salar TaxID=8030 RepID=B5XCT0_SALSA|nr:Lysozyme g [Salmo salar]
MGVGVGIGGFITFLTLASCFGDITKVDTSGASEITARQDKLTLQGVDASHKLAEHNLVRMNKYKELITRVGQKHGLDPAIIAGIISRESRAGSALDHGWGDHGKSISVKALRFSLSLSEGSRLNSLRGPRSTS